MGGLEIHSPVPDHHGAAADHTSRDKGFDLLPLWNADVAPVYEPEQRA